MKITSHSSLKWTLQLHQLSLPNQHINTGWENVLFKLGSERIFKLFALDSNHIVVSPHADRVRHTWHSVQSWKSPFLPEELSRFPEIASFPQRALWNHDDMFHQGQQKQTHHHLSEWLKIREGITSNVFGDQIENEDHQESISASRWILRYILADL